jgi:hypothetical protein
MLYLYLLTYLLALYALPPVTKFFRREILADQQSVAELWKIREHKFKHYSNTNRNESVTAQLLGYFSYKKGLGGKFGGLEFLANFILK